jgi:hypothetical protein
MTARRLALLVVAIGSVAAAGLAQEAPSPMDQATAKAGAAAAHTDDATEARIALPDSPSQIVLSDATTKQKYLESMQRYYEYRANGYAYRSRVFEWQLLSSRVIFLVVLVLVACGIYFAWVQFSAAMLALRRKAAADAAASAVSADAKEAPSPLATQLELSSKGIVINSSVLGVIILGLSLAFFYLYLVYVYPIQNVF